MFAHKSRNGNAIDEETARFLAAMEVLQKRAEALDKTLQEVEEKSAKGEELTPEDQGRYYAAHLIRNFAHNVVVAVETGVADKIARVIQELEDRPDDLDGLDDREAIETLNNFGRYLPAPHQLAALAENSDVAAGLRGETTTYLGSNIAKYVKQLVLKLIGKEPTVEELKAGGRGLDLREAMVRRINTAIVKRAARIISTTVAQIEESLEKAYMSDMASEEFERLLNEKINQEKDLIREIRRYGVEVREMNVSGVRKWAISKGDVGM